MEEYQFKFLAILCRAHNLQPRQQVQLLTPGLVEPIKNNVELQNPASLQMAMALARAYEQHALVAKEITLPPPRTAPPPRALVQAGAGTTAPAATTPLALGPPTRAAPTEGQTAHSWHPLMRRRVLMLEEMATRREAGLCFNCDEKFTPSLRCK